MTYFLEYSNQFFYSFKNTKVLSFVFNGLNASISNIEISTALYDPNLKKKIMHYYLHEVYQGFNQFFESQNKIKKIQSCVIVTGYTLTTRAAIQLNNEILPVINLNCVGVMPGVTHQFLTQIETFLITSKYSSWQEILLSEKFIEGFNAHINFILNNSNLSLELRNQLEASTSLAEICTNLAKLHYGYSPNLKIIFNANNALIDAYQVDSSMVESKIKTLIQKQQLPL